MNEVKKINDYLIGGISFDGMWTKPSSTSITVSEGFSASQSKYYDISSFLPDNDYDYEVYISAFVNTGSTSGNRGEVWVSSSDGDYNCVLCSIITRTSSSRRSVGGQFYPIPKDNQNIRVQNTGNASTVSVYLEAYRRLGTNL